MPGRFPFWFALITLQRKLSDFQVRKGSFFQSPPTFESTDDSNVSKADNCAGK